MGANVWAGPDARPPADAVQLRHFAFVLPPAEDLAAVARRLEQGGAQLGSSEYPEVRGVHRAFALAPTPGGITAIFGSKDAGKREILSHWQAANRNDGGHRINADLMASRPLDYPYSMPGLLACKAAERQGGQEAHWTMFDRLQRAHLAGFLNIADFDVLRQCAAQIGLDVARWEQDYHSPVARDDVERANTPPSGGRARS